MVIVEGRVIFMWKTEPPFSLPSPTRSPMSRQQRSPFSGIPEASLPKQSPKRGNAARSPGSRNPHPTSLKSTQRVATTKGSDTIHSTSLQQLAWGDMDELEVQLVSLDDLMGMCPSRTWTKRTILKKPLVDKERVADKKIHKTGPRKPARSSKKSHPTSAKIQEWVEKKRLQEQQLKLAKSASELLLANPTNPQQRKNRRPQSAVPTKNTNYDEKQHQIQVEQRAKRKMRNRGANTGDLLAMQRRDSKIQSAAGALDMWKSKKLEINTHVKTFVEGQTPDVVECVTEIGIEQIKEDLHTHTVKLKGKTQTLVRKKLKLYVKLMKAGEAGIHVWKQQKRWITLISVILHLLVLIDAGKTEWGKRYKAFKLIILTEWRVRMWVRCLRKKVAARRVRAFLQAIIPTDDASVLLYRAKYAVLKYRRECVFIQSVARGFLVCHHARAHTLYLLKLKMIESEKKKNMLKQESDSPGVIKKWNTARQKVKVFLNVVLDRDEAKKQAAKLRKEQQNKVHIRAYLGKLRKQHVVASLPGHKAALATWKTG